MSDNNFIKDFLKKNWFILWAVLLTVIVVNILIYLDFRSTTNKLKQEIAKTARSVVMLSPTGTVIYQKRVLLTENNNAFKKTLERTLAYYLIASGAQVTNGFTVIPQTPKEVVQYVPKFKIFYDKFLQGQAKFIFVDYLKRIIALLRTNSYPDYIQILNANISNFAITDKGFEITENVRINMAFTDANGKIKRMSGTFVISAEGDFNPQKGSVENPLGITIKNLQIQIPMRNRNTL